MARAVNLVIRRRLSDCAIGVRSRTGQEENDRLLFIAPWREGSIVGTWYYPEFASLDKPGLSEHELSACLAQINSVFPNARLDYEDVSLLHIGLQPAYSGKPGCQEPRLWRHTKILNDGSRTGQDGLYWVQGVKLTTARSTAVEVIERVARYLKKNISPSGTDETPLYGADFDDYGKYKRACHEKLSGHYPEHVISRLLANYGSCLDVIVRLMKQDESLAEYVPGTTDTIRAELKYVIENEMPETLADVVLRRTDMGSFSCPDRKTLEFCANMMGGYFDWNETERRNQIENLLQHYPRYHN